MARKSIRDSALKSRSERLTGKSTMLRTLGIAFIACSLMLFGITIGGVSWWLISSGVVTIRGVNERPNGHGPQASEETDSAPPAFDTTSAATTRRMTSSGIPVRLASLSSATGTADVDLGKKLGKLSLQSVTGMHSNTTYTFQNPGPNPIVFPNGTTQIKLTFISDRVIDTDTSEEALKNAFIITAGTFNITRPQQATLNTLVMTVTPSSSFTATLIDECVGGTSQVTVNLANGALPQPSIASSLYGSPASSDPPSLYNYLRADFPASINFQSLRFYLRTDDDIVHQITPQKTKAYNINTEAQDKFGAEFLNNPVITSLAPNATIRFFAVHQSGELILSSAPITLQKKTQPGQGSSSLSRLQFGNDQSNQKSKTIAGMTYVTTTTPDLSTAISAPPTDAVLVLREATLGVKKIIPATPTANFQTLNLPPGRHTLTAELYQGSTTLASTEPLSIHVLDKGPEPPVVDASGFTILDTGIIRLKFAADNPLAPSTIVSQNFLLHTDPPSSTPVNQISTPHYDQNTGTVELRFDRDASPGNYILKVKNGLSNVLGMTLGTPATNDSRDFEIRLTKSAGTDIPVERRGLTGLTGDSPEYKEYTEPRNYPEGFNPSDKVVSRMARLYYFRDAHRVVQLINRKAQSFNRAAVDMQEQVADAVRREAERTTADRQTAENRAIRAAQQARAAEEALEQHQQALITNRRKVADLTNDLAQVDGILRELETQKSVIAAEFTEAELRELEGLQTKEIQNGTTDPTGKFTSGLDSNEITRKNALLTKQGAALRRRELLASAPAVELSNLDLADPGIPTRRLNQTREALRRQLADAESQVQQEESIVRQMTSNVRSEREQEVVATEKWDNLEREEKLKREEQFRREVAAGKADPDTYVAGRPDSDDPVAQVSLAVAGEGLIQMRGPRKGINEVHKMINEIDSPVGQVKIAIHTVQVNGEHGDRMQEVVHRIHSYMDHSRFLTMQSSQLLRNAVVLVASRRAEQAAAWCPPGTTPAQHDFKYQEAFFGDEFIQELRTMDSEFLQTNNKILSLHSMDTTSLSNALFLMSLAKNDVRQEILAEFMLSLRTKLPQYELEFYQGSAPKPAWRDRSLAEKIKPGAIREKHLAPFQFMAPNAQFASLRGFFDVAVADPNTMTPMQREFVRLAQIFKARLVTETELRQRIMERALIEERVGNYQQSLQEAASREKQANQEKENARAEVLRTAALVHAQLAPIRVAIRTIAEESEAARNPTDDNVIAIINNVSDKMKSNDRKKIAGNLPLGGVLNADDSVSLPITLGRQSVQLIFSKNNREKPAVSGEANVSVVVKALSESEFAIRKCITTFKQYRLLTEHATRLSMAEARNKDLAEGLSAVKPGTDRLEPLPLINALRLASRDISLVGDHVREKLRPVEMRAAAIQQLFSDLAENPSHAVNLITEWEAFRRETFEWLDPMAPPLTSETSSNQNRFQQARSMFTAVEHLLGLVPGQNTSSLLNQIANYRAAVAAAENLRKPLDHKKFLDMLIDDAEETYIDLVEGTRAQTATIDNYLQRLGTALEDDFNTQFYQPAFRRVQESSYFYDVSVGQIETTSIVANNRMFAKVSPQATMEFDLPKRDILINEAANSALAAYNDYGALLGDPNFVSLLKLYGGQSPANTYGGLGSPQIIRPLPGLPSGTDSQYMTSPSNNVPRIGSSLESLIPDPAVYKFETGTGYEIRPVIQPDGQAVTFHLNYLYSTNIREPVRADEKHLGRIRQHAIDTDVVSGNYELREVSTYRVVLKAARSARGVPFLEDVPGVGVLFRPAVNAESSLQENVILSQSVIYPTLFDLMGLRWAPAVAELDTNSLQERRFVTSQRERFLKNEVFDNSSAQVDEFLRVDEARRRADLYRAQQEIPLQHPTGYNGPGMNIQQGFLIEDSPAETNPTTGPTTGGPNGSQTFVPPTDAVPPAVPPVPAPTPASWSAGRQRATSTATSGRASLDAEPANTPVRTVRPATTPRQQQKPRSTWALPGFRH